MYPFAMADGGIRRATGRWHLNRGRITRRRGLIAPAGAAAMGVLAAACGPFGAREQPRPRMSPAGLRWANNWGAESAYVELMDATIQQFQQKHPGVTVEKEFLRGAFQEAVFARVAAGTLADVNNFGAGFAGPLPQIYLDLAPYLKVQKVNLNDLLTMRSHQQGGRVLALPVSLIANVWLGNLSLFERANVPAPKVDWTWDDALDAFRRITSALSQPDREVFGADLATRNPEMSILPLTKAAGGEWWDKDYTRLFPQQEPALEAWTWIVEAHARHKVAPVFGADGHLIDRAIGPTPFDNQRIAAMARHVGWSGHCIRNKCQFNWDFLPQPVHPKTRKAFAIYWDGTAVMVSAQTKFPDQAARLALFHLDDFFQMRLNLHLRSGVPSVKRLWDHPDFKKPPPASWSVVTRQLAGADSYDEFPARNEVMTILWQNLVEATKGTIGVTDSFRKTVAEVNNAFSVYKRR